MFFSEMLILFKKLQGFLVQQEYSRLLKIFVAEGLLWIGQGA
jgi:hypothetical protein